MHGNVWQLQEAKSRFSELVEKAMTEGPQMVTRRGSEAVVVASTEDYRRESRANTPLKDFFRKPPYFETGLDFVRSGDLPRKVDL